MTFGKKVVNPSTGNSDSNYDSSQWDAWNQHVYEEVFEGEWNKLPNGKQRKEINAVGVLNFILDVGTQAQGDASMESKLAKPAQGEEYSAEELAEMEKYPTNYFKWVDDYRDGKTVTVRKKFWPKQPESELIFAIDFPAHKADYSKHPMANGEGESKAYRIDYNSKDFKDKSQVGKHITNDVHWKTGKFSDKDIKYKIATAAGNVEEYIADSHDLAHLVQATCNWTIVLTKDVREKDGKTYTNYYESIKDPAVITDIKFQGKVFATKDDQLKLKEEAPEFCGILLNGGDYSKEQLQQVRGMWWNIAKQAKVFDRNEGTDRDGEWIVGEGWEGSDLEKAYKEFGFDTQQSSQASQQGESNKQGNGSSKSEAPQQKAPEKKEPVKQAPVYNEPPMDMSFDDD